MCRPFYGRHISYCYFAFLFLKRFRADALNFFDVLYSNKRAVGGAIVDDRLSVGRADAGQSIELASRRGVNIRHPADRRRGRRLVTRCCSPCRRRWGWALQRIADIADYGLGFGGWLSRRCLLARFFIDRRTEPKT